MNRLRTTRACAGAIVAAALLPALAAHAAPVAPSISVLGGNVVQRDNGAPGTYLSVTGAGFTPGGGVRVRVLDANGATLFDSASLPVRLQASTPGNDRAYQLTATRGSVLPGGHIGLQIRIPPISARVASVVATDLATAQQIAISTSIGY